MTEVRKISLPPEAMVALAGEGVVTDELRQPPHPKVKQVCREYVMRLARAVGLFPSLRNRALMFSSHGAIAALEQGRKWREEHLDEGLRN